MDLVPIVDIRSPDSASLNALDAACSDHGFFLLEGHGLDDLIERTWQQTRRFFTGPDHVKESVRRTRDEPLGYFDRELTKRRRDCKEVFDFAVPGGRNGRDRNRWPSGIDGFRETQSEFFAAFSALAADTLGLVQRALGASDSVIAAGGGSAAVSTVRLNHYPVADPLAEAERKGLPELGDVALGHHTDPGILTLLLQDDTGGLQTLSRNDGWIDVPPRPGTIVVNLADSLQVQTNDRYRAAVHRVVPMTDRDRYSIPYFYNPPIDAVIEPIGELCDGPPHYRAFSWREFIQARIDDNFEDLGADDTQASHYRIG